MMEESSLSGTGNSAPVLQVKGMSIHAGGKRLLDKVDIAVSRGEIVGLTGPSGCGKSTLLRAICGLIDAEAGEVWLDGRKAGDWGWPCFRRRMVLVTQKPALIDATVKENLMRPFSYHSSEGIAFPVSRAEGLLAKLQIEGRMDQAARSLSVGEQQRLCLVRALLLTPEVLLLDEPTSALDEVSVSLVENIVAGEAMAGRLGVLVVSHDRAQVSRWCHRHIELAAFRPGEEQPNG